MSAASSFAATADCVQPAPVELPADPAGWQLARNSACVPGGLCAVPLPAPIEAGGLTWGVHDAGPHGASIGYALALETAGGAS